MVQLKCKTVSWSTLVLSISLKFTSRDQSHKTFRYAQEPTQVKESILMGHPRPLVRAFFVFSNKQYNNFTTMYDSI